MNPEEKLSEHFKASEFQCHDGSPLPDDFAVTICDTVVFLEKLRSDMNALLRKRTGHPHDVGLVIVSGHRTEKYNRRCGGAKTSRHVSGHAVDVKPTRPYDDTFSYSDFRELCERLDRRLPNPYRLGFYSRKGAGAWVHVDCAYGHGGRRWGS